MQQAVYLDADDGDVGEKLREGRGGWSAQVEEEEELGQEESCARQQCVVSARETEKENVVYTTHMIPLLFSRSLPSISTVFALLGLSPFCYCSLTAFYTNAICASVNLDAVGMTPGSKQKHACRF